MHFVGFCNFKFRINAKKYIAIFKQRKLNIANKNGDFLGKFYTVFSSGRDISAPKNKKFNVVKKKCNYSAISN